MDKQNFHRPHNPLWRDDEELRSIIEGETNEDIIRRVSNDFAKELANIMSGSYKASGSKPDEPKDS